MILASVIFVTPPFRRTDARVRYVFVSVFSKTGIVGAVAAVPDFTSSLQARTESLTSQLIDYEQLYAQAMHEIHHGERYWFDSEDEQIMTENNREFEQTPAMLQLFYQYFKAAQTKEEGEFLTPVEILNYLKKKSGISLSDNKVYHFGRLLQKCGIPSKHTYKGTVYQVIKVL